MNHLLDNFQMGVNEGRLLLTVTAIIAKYLGFQCFITCYRNSPFFVNMNLIINQGFHLYLT